MSSIDDALELMLAGASAVQVGVMNSVDKLRLPKLIDALPAALEKYRLDKVSDVTGALRDLPENEDEWTAIKKEQA